MKALKKTYITHKCEKSKHESIQNNLKTRPENVMTHQHTELVDVIIDIKQAYHFMFNLLPAFIFSKSLCHNIFISLVLCFQLQSSTIKSLSVPFQ